MRSLESLVRLLPYETTVSFWNVGVLVAPLTASVFSASLLATD
jgi:hypothetical protein